MRIASLSTFEVFRLRILGLISGRVTVLAPEVAGDVTVRLPSTSGTLAVEGGAGATALSGLTDVDLTSPSDAEVLTYDAGSSTWKNAAGGAGVLQQAVVDLDTADLLTLFSSPVQLVDGSAGAISAGKSLKLVDLWVQYLFNTRPIWLTAPECMYQGAGDNVLADVPSTLFSRFSNQVLFGGHLINGFSARQSLAENKDLVLADPFGADASGFGGITASALNAAGTGYAPGDTGTIGANPPQGAAYVVDTVLVGAVVTYHIGSPGYSLEVDAGQATTPAAITPTIISVNQGTKKFGVQGNFAAFFALPFTSVVVAGSTGNDGTYTIVSAAYAAGVTLVTVVEALPSSVADGTITAGQAGAGDAAFTVDVSAIVPGDGSARVWVTYFIADLA